MDYSFRDPVSGVLVTARVADLLAELARLAGVNGFTAANQTAAINALTDAQIAAFVRRILINGFAVST